MLLIALSVAGTAGYFSIFGLSQLFAGASTAVIIMATVLEIAKVITTTALHKYWTKLAIGLKIYLTIGVAVLMLITSAGIYGFLSNAYQKTANKLEIHEGELSVLGGKKQLFEKNITDNEKIVVTKNKRIDQLTDLGNRQETRLDLAKSNRAKDKVRNDIALATNEIQKLSTDIDGLNSKNGILSDSVGKYNTKALELKSGSEVAGEVGPLKYIAELTGAPMGNVVNYLILLLIFVFDPLAIALILMTNRVFQLQGDINPLEAKKIALKEPLNVPIDIFEHVKSEDVSEDVIPDDQFDDNNVIKETVPDIILIPKPQVDEDSVPSLPVVEETKLVSEKAVEVPVYKKEPVIPTGKIEVEDIKEIKENRGYSVPIPSSKSNNTIERISTNKVIKNGDNNKVFFKRK
jgi:hypothetical protein